MSEEYKTIDIGEESPQQLEALEAVAGSKWLGHIRRNILINVVASIALGVGIGFLIFEAITIKGPHSDWRWMAILVICLLTLGLIGSVHSFIENINRLFYGPPKAGRTPEETVNKYFTTLMRTSYMPTNLNQHDWVSAYVCLLEQCKQAFGGYDSFISFWKDAEKALSHRIVEYFKPCRRNILISVVVSIALGVGIGFFIFKAIKSPRSDWAILVLPLALFLILSVYSFFANIIRLFYGPPKAGRTPEETVNKYFISLMRTNLNQHDWLSAYVCLLDQCKQAFGGYDSFISFWEDTEKALSHRIVEYCKPCTFSWTKWVLGECSGRARPDGLTDYEVNFEVRAYVPKNGRAVSALHIGTVIVTAIVPLAQIGDRWYIARTEWSPQLMRAELRLMGI